MYKKNFKIKKIRKKNIMDEKIYYPDLTNSKSFKIDKNKYKEMYQESISNPE